MVCWNGSASKAALRSKVRAMATFGYGSRYLKEFIIVSCDLLSLPKVHSTSKLLVKFLTLLMLKNRASARL